jgi:hypothetical protein
VELRRAPIRNPVTATGHLVAPLPPNALWQRSLCNAAN